MTAATATRGTGSRSPRWTLPAGLRRCAVPLALLVLWQASVGFGWISTRSIPSPSQILTAFWDLTVSGELAVHLLVSLGRVSAGLAIGVSVGTVCALIAGLSRRGEDALDSLLQMLRTLPHLALVPLFILWFGIGETPKIALVALGTAFPIYLNLFAGIRTVDAKVVEAVSTLGLTRWEMIAQVILPGALPAFLTGLRYALGVAWLSLVVGEQINASSGIGYLAMTAREFLRTDVIIVALIVYAVLGLLADLIVRVIERRALVWRPAFIKE
ncbi:ABC transporter permease (plasmid) [Azospirillum humicireducens]|uniref:ABC transporter permease n=1 Tax=Azospirillum humicireducens TaxID=1226968 RepID=A0A2R4VRR0_9PROT|nr:ABC transporter permease subunit [Azospirillum humicireducens]AWB07115.1 ABC transporter permease [Azospirillum humicireducens]